VAQIYKIFRMPKRQDGYLWFDILDFYRYPDFFIIFAGKKYPMLEIGKTLISLDLIASNFTCNLSVCKGACCITGDSGAPLEFREAEKLKEIYPVLRPFLRVESQRSIDEQGTSVTDMEGDTVTPLNDGRECSYVIFENGIARCAIEKAFNEGFVDFRKPVSCYLYPVRIKKYRLFDAVNYDRWEICHAATKLGDDLQMPVYRFVKDALAQHYGAEWFNLLEIAAKNLEIEKNS
jgi:hypothetical protein